MSEDLTRYFLQYIDSFSVNRSKNKGRKAKLFAIMEVYSLADANKIFDTEHIINGKKIKISPYHHNKRPSKKMKRKVIHVSKVKDECYNLRNEYQKNTEIKNYNLESESADPFEFLGSHKSGVLSADFQPEMVTNFKGLDWDFI